MSAFLVVFPVFQAVNTLLNEWTLTAIFNIKLKIFHIPIVCFFMFDFKVFRTLAIGTSHCFEIIRKNKIFHFEVVIFSSGFLVKCDVADDGIVFKKGSVFSFTISLIR